MSRIKIKNFGPIRDGFVENDGWMDVKKVTVLIGDQGSGKSTVAKLISLFTWLEKNIIRNSVSTEQLNAVVFKNLCFQQELIEYFAPNTILKFEGDSYDFEYIESEQSFVLKKNENNNNCYVLPKIQYVSAARNLLTILYNISLQNIVDKNGNIIDMSSNIPFMVKELNKEYMKALQELAKDGFALPINDTSVFFQEHSAFIVTQGKRVSMSAASSGIQSITPLLLVSHFLSEKVRENIFDKIQYIDNNLKNRIEDELSKVSGELSDKFKQLYSFGKGILSIEEDVSLLESKLKQFIPSSFINIVEEPEQNLFPNSQQKVINSLIEYNNAIKENKLIISTHSPYILSALNNSILAEEAFEKTGRSIDSYGPEKRVAFDDVSAYLLEDGKIYNIKDDETRLIKAEAIDNCSDEINSDFDSLLDLIPDNED